MSVRFAELTYEAAGVLLAEGAHALLPTGAVEAHGPHLPLGTDVVIAEEAALRAARTLAAEGIRAAVLPPIAFTVADYAGGFAGTLSVSADALAGYLLSVVSAASRAGFRSVTLCNAHLDPANREVLLRVVREAGAKGLPLAFPDIVRRANAARLGAEFVSGACHAGRFETSLVLAARPDLVDTEAAGALPPNPASLVEAIAEGRRTFEAAGGPRAYFGWPADATAAEGDTLYAALAEIFADAVRACASRTPAGA